MPAAKNDKFWPKTWPWLLPALALLAAVRLHGLSVAAFPDYDSVRNWQIVQEIAGGNWQHLFHHASPGFFLLYAPVAALHPDFHVFLYLNALLAVAAVGWLAAFVGRVAALPSVVVAVLALVVGTSLLLTFSGRDFTISSAGLLAFVGLLQAYYQRLGQPSRQTLLRAALWLAVGLLFQYRFLLVLPILAVFEGLQRDGLLWQRGNLLRVAAVLGAPYVLLGLVGWLMAGLPVYRWEAAYAGILFPSVANAAHRSGNFRLDLGYYPRYLWEFGSPLLWLGVLATPVFAWGSWVRTRPWTPAGYLSIWAGLFLAGMSLLLKAPRGLLFAEGLFTVLGVLALQQGLQRVSLRQSGSILVGLLLAAAGWNLYRLPQEIYRYAPTSYPQVVAWLRQHKVQRVASTVGMGVAPFARPAGIEVYNVHTLAQLQEARRAGITYVLLDGYRLVTGVDEFTGLENNLKLTTFPEPMLTSPLLFLEHSEFTGATYAETLARQQQAASAPAQLTIMQLAPAN
ncbi:hypothetical protein HER32_05745 [Hymenobacter sp. BT18]|uniref:hypothetical protein n=1 Tax=Hymenobacter sp. BT18 TaxID=2835648 RepID=UPI00143E5759|nr:hypothetical protein [Hymenobacter sp. BT18]QIX60702.1 hypothetical protein HER32_05745 [Hymenobacter sp. BT18]